MTASGRHGEVSELTSGGCARRPGSNNRGASGRFARPSAPKARRAAASGAPVPFPEPDPDRSRSWSFPPLADRYTPPGRVLAVAGSAHCVCGRYGCSSSTKSNRLSRPANSGRSRHGLGQQVPSRPSEGKRVRGRKLPERVSVTEYRCRFRSRSQPKRKRSPSLATWSWALSSRPPRPSVGSTTFGSSPARS